VSGTAGFGLELELSAADIKMLDLGSHRTADAELGTIPAILREVQDIPKYAILPSHPCYSLIGSEL
jgi:hypothetical protein